MRSFLLGAAAFLGLAVLFAVLAPLAALWPTLAWRNRLSLLAGRVWSRGMLRLGRVRVVYRGLEHLAARPAILLFNHQSSLDFLLIAPLAGSRCLVFGKRELARAPFLGWGWVLGGHPLIRREDREHWQAEMDRVARLVRDHGYSTVVAPEGHRSRDGRLLPFKKGAFHLALQTRRPLVPVVLEGSGALMRGRRVPRAGEVRATLLPPVDTSGWREADLDRHVEEMERRYLDALGQEAVATVA